MIHKPIVDEKELLKDGAHAALKNNVALLRVFVYGSDIAMDADPNTSRKRTHSPQLDNWGKQPKRSDAGSATTALISSCVNAPCEILGVIRSPAFLVGSSRSIRSMNKTTRETEAAAVAKTTSVLSAQTASLAASVSSLASAHASTHAAANAAAHAAAHAAALAATQALAMPMDIPGSTDWHGQYSLSCPPANAPVNTANDNTAMYDHSTGDKTNRFDAESPSTEFSNEPVKKRARLGGHQHHPDPISLGEHYHLDLLMMDEEDFIDSLSTMLAKSNVPELPKIIEDSGYCYQKICSSDTSDVVNDVNDVNDQEESTTTTARSLPTHPAPSMVPTIPVAVLSYAQKDNEQDTEGGDGGDGGYDDSNGGNSQDVCAIQQIIPTVIGQIIPTVSPTVQTPIKCPKKVQQRPELLKEGDASDFNVSLLLPLSHMEKEVEFNKATQTYLGVLIVGTLV